MGANPQMYHPVNKGERKPKACFVGQRYADRDRWLLALIEANVPIEVYGAGWAIDEQRAPDGEPIYLGRRQVTPGSLESYMRVAKAEVRQHGVFRAARRLSERAVYRRKTRRIAQSIRSCWKGRAGDIASVFGDYEICLNFSNVWTDDRPGSSTISHVRLRDFEAPMCRTCYLTGHNDEIADFYVLGREIDTYRDKSELIDKTRFYLAHATAAEKLREAGYRRAIRDHSWTRRFDELFQKIGVNKNSV
jgi:hypothetical protein